MDVAIGDTKLLNVTWLFEDHTDVLDPKFALVVMILEKEIRLFEVQTEELEPNTDLFEFSNTLFDDHTDVLLLKATLGYKSLLDVTVKLEANTDLFEFSTLLFDDQTDVLDAKFALAVIILLNDV